MNKSGSPPTKRMRLSGEELSKIDKDEIIDLYIKQQDQLDKLKRKSSDADKDDASKKAPIAETSRRENVLMMRLATKDQEIQQYAAQISHIKKSQEDAAAKSLREALLDPAVNLLFNKIKDELKETKDKLEQAQSELSAWKFTPDSQTGKKLMSRCRTLIAENQELGRQLSQGKVAQLEAELALQKKYSEELKESQEELNEFVIQLDEEVEGMQSTIQLLQQQLMDSRRELEKYKKIADNTDLMDNTRTKSEAMDINMKIEREISTMEKEIGDDVVNTKEEVGVNHDFENQNGDESPGERSFENSEFVCKEECGSDGENELNGDNENPMEVDTQRLNNLKQGEMSPPYSEHDIIDESQDSSPEHTPKRIFSENGSASIEHKNIEPLSADLSGQMGTPVNDETYAVIDNGSDDETRHIAHIVGTNDTSGLNAEPVAGSFEAVPKTPTHDPELVNDFNIKDQSNTAHSGDLLQTSNTSEPGNILDSNTGIDENGIAYESAISNELDTEQQSENVQNPTYEEVEESVAPASEETKQDMNITDDVILIDKEGVDKPATEVVSELPQVAQNLVTRTEVQIPLNGPQTTLPPLAHSLMPHSHVPLMGDSSPYVMNPHFQQLQGTAMAQQQAIMADLMYKSMLAQQQQLAMTEDKNNHLPEGSNALRTGEEQRTAMNPLVHGLPYADPQTAFMAQYKAMLAAQQMFMPVADGKTPQMLAPGGMGLYPGIPPLVQPTVMPQASTDHVTNGVTNVTYAPHPLMKQGFLGANPAAGMMLYAGHNLAPHGVPAPVPVDMDKHHGSGDHGPMPNGYAAQKTPDVSDTNPKEDPHIVA